MSVSDAIQARPVIEATGGGRASALRMALRELRGGLRGFYVFIACIAIGVAAIAGVGSLARAMSDGLAREGRVVLGGDLSFSIVQRPATEVERAYFDGLGRVSEIITLRGMARATAERQALVEIKVVDDAYPLTGAVVLDADKGLGEALAANGDVRQVAVEPGLLARLDLEVGDQVSLGRQVFTIAASIDIEPDRLSNGPGFGPRVLLSKRDLEATGLVQPGSLVRYHYRVALANPAADDAELQAEIAAAEAEFPDAGWSARTRFNASPGLSTSIDRFAQFLTLVGLTALIVGGVGVANAVRAFMETKRDVIGTLKAVGASGSFVFQLYLTQIALIALLATLIGVVIGALIPPIAGMALQSVLPVSAANGIYFGELLLAIAYGLLTALAFALWPLGRARDIPVSALFRDQVEPTRRRPRAVYIVAIAIVLAILATMATSLAAVPSISMIYIGAAAIAFFVLRLVALAIMAIARRIPRVRSATLRLAIGNVHRPGALTPSVVLSLGLGLALLVALGQIDGNLSRQLTSAIPEKAPSFFFLDIQNPEEESFRTLIDEVVPGGALDTVPMLRGRVISLKGIPSAEFNAPPEARWVLRGDRGITYSAEIPTNSTVVEGAWWPTDYDGPPLVSFVDEEARELGLEIGDTVTVNVLGRTITAEIASLREVSWSSMGINFLMVFSPNTFAGAPHALLATVTYPENLTDDHDQNVLRAVTAAFPAVTSVRIKDALDTINGLMTQIGWGIRAASSITLVASILVLGGALAAGHRHRIYDAVIFKTLGATRRTLLTAYAMEYLMLGLATALFGVLAGTAAAYVVVTQVMAFDFVVMPAVAVGGALIALVVTVALGIGGTWTVLDRKPARVLRAL